jgi:hypothetical protein
MGQGVPSSSLADPKSPRSWQKDSRKAMENTMCKQLLAVGDGGIQLGDNNTKYMII